MPALSLRRNQIRRGCDTVIAPFICNLAINLYPYVDMSLVIDAHFVVTLEKCHSPFVITSSPPFTT